MRIRRSFSVIAIIVLLILTACGGRAPAGAPCHAPLRCTRRSGRSKQQRARADGRGPTGHRTHELRAAPTPTTRAPLPPTVVSMTPDRGEEQVLSAPVVVTFDQPMDPASTSSAFSIEPKVPGEVKVSGNALDLQPDRAAWSGTRSTGSRWPQTPRAPAA